MWRTLVPRGHSSPDANRRMRLVTVPEPRRALSATARSSQMRMASVREFSNFHTTPAATPMPLSGRGAPFVNRAKNVIASVTTGNLEQPAGRQRSSGTRSSPQAECDNHAPVRHECRTGRGIAAKKSLTSAYPAINIGPIFIKSILLKSISYMYPAQPNAFPTASRSVKLRRCVKRG